MANSNSNSDKTPTTSTTSAHKTPRKMTGKKYTKKPNDKRHNSSLSYSKLSSPTPKSAFDQVDFSSSGFRVSCKQLHALIVKTVHTMLYHYILSLMEIVLPIVFIVISAWLILRAQNNTDDKSNKNDNDSLIVAPKQYPNPTFTIDFKSKDFFPMSTLYYAPSNNVTNYLTNLFEKSGVLRVPLADDKTLHLELEKILAKNTSTNPKEIAMKSFQHFAVYFDQNIDNNDEKGKKLSYKIRIAAEKEEIAEIGNLFPTKTSQNPNPTKHSINFYTKFSKICAYINRAYIEQFCPSKGECKQKLLLPIAVNQMPYPKHQTTKGAIISKTDIVSILVNLSFLFSSTQIVRRITQEKAAKARELLRMFGLSDLVYWLSHFVVNFVFLVIQIAMFAVFLFSTQTLKYTSLTLFVLMHMSYGVQMILFSMAISTLFNRTTIAVIASVAVFIGSQIAISLTLYPSFQTTDISSHNTERFFTSFLPTGSVLWTFSIISTMENNRANLDLDTINSPNTLYQNFTCLSVLIAILNSYLIYFILIWYLDNVWPFQHGVPKSPIFPFQPSYWFPKKQKINQNTEIIEKNPKTFEKEPTNLSAQIRIYNIKKVFRDLTTVTAKVAVKNVTMNIYQSEITVLLGHNGAGKSTTMNMITGMCSVSAGSIYVNDYNISNDTQKARRSMGMCTQENIFFKELTVYQHLKLFALLKNFPYSKIDSEINQSLRLLMLNDKRNVLVDKLSGGMKRRLQLGLALVGGTSILILDEPTSGLDPESRRIIWDLLLSLRSNRTILLTTHFMEEAEALGDRIAIMNDGLLCCAGSPMFLKKQFGDGYSLRIAKKSSFNSAEFEKVIKRFASGATLISEIETEVVYNLGVGKKELSKKVKTISPTPEEEKEEGSSSRNQSKSLAKLFEEIDKNRKKYGIESYGMSYTTLEDVFLLVGADVETKAVHADSDNKKNDTPTTTTTTTTTSPQQQQQEQPNDSSFLTLTNKQQLLRGWALWRSQMKGLLLKRIHFARRYWPMIVFQFILPNLFVFLTMTINRSLSWPTNHKDEINKNLNLLKMYGEDTKPFYYGDAEHYRWYKELNLEQYKATTVQIPEFKGIVSEENKIAEWIIEQGNSDLNLFVTKFVYGLRVFKDRFQTWFNNEQFHSIPLSIIALQESLLRMAVPPEGLSQVSINVTNSPVHMSEENKMKSTMQAQTLIGWIVTCMFLMPIVLPFLTTSYIIFPVKERASKSRLLQLMTGLSPYTYWLSNFMFDLLIFQITVATIMVIFYCLDTNDLFFNPQNNYQAGYAFYVLLTGYGVHSIALIYFWSLHFSVPTSAFSILIVFSILFGLISNIVMTLIDILPKLMFEVEGSGSSGFGIAMAILRIEPTFATLFGFQKVYQLSNFNKMCEMLNDNLELMCNLIANKSAITGCCPKKCGDNCYSKISPFGFTIFGSGIEICCLFGIGLLVFILLPLYEKLQSKIAEYGVYLFRKRTTTNWNDQDIENDVEKERNRIEKLIYQKPNDLTDLLTVDRIGKRFGSFLAVDNLSFGVHFNECFGLLGVNGAGKTTLFSMLTGDLKPSVGDAFMERGRLSLRRNASEMQKNIGYCPQFDALLDNLSGEETLYLFARLRGIPRRFLKRDVANLIAMAGLESHYKNRTENYSGGNRRKLSLSIALMGVPSVLFLDEPTSGIDPAARRKLWALLSNIKRHLNSSIVLTSHSMDECEALCARVAIMVNGRFQCLGSIQHLREKYCQGFSVTIRLPADSVNNKQYNYDVRKAIEAQFTSAKLKDHHQCTMNYQIGDKNENWSNIFRQMSQLNKQFHFEDYVVAGTSLEQIFLTFARAQNKK